MKTVENFLKSMLLFIFLPIPWFYMEFIGSKPRGSWNTWLLDNESSARRQFDVSVNQMLGVWFIFFSMVVFTTVKFLFSDTRTWCIFMVILSAVWFIVLYSKIMLSYETWNWMKAIKFAVRLHETNHTSKELIGKAVASFLVQEMVIAKKNDSFKEFNHLENVLRALNIWNGQRKDIAEQARKLDK